MDLEMKALEILKIEYKEALKNNESFMKLLEIKQRMETIKDLIIEDLLKKVG